jgi:hypothetical protein
VILTAPFVSSVTCAAVRSICLAQGEVGGADDANLNSTGVDWACASPMPQVIARAASLKGALVM